MSWFTVFVSVIVADYAWAKFITAASTGKRWQAATWSAALYLVGSVAIVGFTRNHWLLIPAVLGAFVGTAIGVKNEA